MPPEPRQLQQLALDHVLRQADQNIEDRKIPLAQRHLERLHVQPVAREHAHVIAPARVRARTSAPRLRAVDHVVVNQRRAVDHLHHRAHADRARPAISGRARRQQQQRRPQPLAAAFAQIARDFGDRLDRRAILRRNFLLDERQIVAHQIENPFCDLYCEGHMNGFCSRLYLGRFASVVSPRSLRLLPVSSLKNRRKFAAVVAATSSGAKFLTFANACATSTTNAGSLRFPRRPCGGRNGESVSVSNLSSGISRATSRKCCIFGYVTLPANEIRNPMSIPRRAFGKSSP